jgi:DNA-binding PadR family transcriptional regulator
MKDVKTLSEARVSLSTGTLYGAIKRLLDQGWILRVDEPAEDENGRERKAYVLTQRGRRILEAETARLGKLYHAAQLRVVGEER